MQQLQFRKDGSFHILAFGDVHEKLCGGDKTQDYLALVDAALEDAKPDFVVYLGDLVQTDLDGGLMPEEDVRKQLLRITEPVTSRHIPFGVTFGNHDGEQGQPKSLLLSILREFPGFMNMEDYPEISGLGNCNLPILSSDGSRKAFNLWLMDSGSNDVGGVGYYVMKPDQIHWYEEKAQALKAENGGEPLPAILFQHIPVMEEYRLLQRCSKWDPYAVEGWHSFKGLFFKKNPATGVTGYLGEGPGCPCTNSGQFESWKRQGDIIGAFFGHDHLNDFIGDVDGIILGQCKATGFHMYGDGLHQGVRSIVINENAPRKLETKMLYYRDYYGTVNLTIHGYDLLTDRWHTNFKRTLAVLGTVGGVAITCAAVKGIQKHCKKK